MFHKSINCFHSGDQIERSFISMITSLFNPAAMGKIQKNIKTKVRPVGLINTETKGIQNIPPFMKVVYMVGCLDTGIPRVEQTHPLELFQYRKD